MLQAVERRGQLFAQMLAVAIGHDGIVAGGDYDPPGRQRHSAAPTRKADIHRLLM